MIYELAETGLAGRLFENWEGTMIYSCIQKMMGKMYVIDQNDPRSVMACIGDLIFFAGKPCMELVMNKPEGFTIMVPQTNDWASLIEKCYADKCRKVIRYAMKKNTVFNKEYLTGLLAELPKGCHLHFIDKELYEQCLKNQWSRDLVSVFESQNEYLEKGIGTVAIKNDEIIAGASSYTRYREGIEIQVDTRKDERRKHLATTCCAKLILACLERGLYPSWDAQNLWSVHLAEKLGYELSHEYIAYEVN